jgi:hypothetical protein
MLKVGSWSSSLAEKRGAATLRRHGHLETIGVMAM